MTGIGTFVVKRPTSVGILSRGKDYSVKDLGESSQGYTNLLKRELGVSLRAEGGMVRWTQLHELSHVKHSLWSPSRIVARVERMTGRKLPVMAVLAAEDARINELLVRKVPDAHKGFRLTTKSLRYDLEGYAACHASPKAVKAAIRERVDAEAADAIDAFLARLADMPDRELTVLRVTVPLATLIDDLKRKETGGADGKAEPEPGEGEGESSAGDEEPEDADGPSEASREDDGEPGEPDGEDEGEPEGGDMDEDSEPAGRGGEDPAEPSGDDEDAEPEDGEGSGDASDGDAEDEGAFGEPDAHMGGETCAQAVPEDGEGERPYPWVVPTVCEPALTVPMRGGNFQVATAETGTALRWQHAHRIVTDGVVFRRARRKPGTLQRGTVLIDASGSMHLEDEDIDKLVNMLPHGTVAIYSGDFVSVAGRGEYKYVAHVVVVARGGRRVASVADRALVPRGGGNMCDGPALLWLSRQPGPRLWICDGMVTGTADRPAAWQAGECGAIMRAAGIVQVSAAVYRDAGGRAEVRLRATRTLVADGAGRINLEALSGILRDLERGRI